MAAPARRKVPPRPTLPLSAGPPANEAGGILTISLPAIAANYRQLARKVMPAECSAVIKANGYGCGLDQVAATLVEAGCKTFFVAQIEEARRVRARAPEATIYVLDGFSPDAGPVFAETRSQPVINSALELAEWDHFTSASGWRGGFALHVDTGMNRLGLPIEEAVAIAPRIHSGNHGVTLIMSHFACSETPDHPLNAAQIAQFREIRTLYRGIPASLANSAGVFLGPLTYCDMVRPGIALFGGNPTPGQPNPMQPVVELKARILQIRIAAKDSTVGYGAAWTAPRDTRVAIVAAGYADGFLRATERTEAGGRQVLVAGTRCPIVGRISMDLFAVDISALPERAVRRGDFVTLVGGELDIDTVAAQAGTISYELLTNFGQRYRRVWIENTSG